MGKVYHKDRIKGLDVRFGGLVEAWLEELVFSVEIFVCHCNGKSPLTMDALPLVQGVPVKDEDDADWPIADMRLEAMCDTAERMGFVCGHHQQPKNSKHFELR